MSKKSSKLIGHTFFSKKPKVGDYQLQPINAGRMVILEEKGNPLAVGEEGEVNNWAVYEAFMVATMESGDLLDSSLMDADAWSYKVRAFGLDVSDDDLNAFWNVFQAEMEEINKSKVKEVAGKTGGKRVNRGGNAKKKVTSQGG